MAKLPKSYASTAEPLPESDRVYDTRVSCQRDIWDIFGLISRFGAAGSG